MGMEENATYDVTKFVRTPFAVEFGGVMLGGTEGPVNIKPKITTEDVTCNQAGGKIIKRIITGIKYTITAKFKQPETVLQEMFSLSGTITKDMLGVDLYTQAKELKLSAIGASNVVYDFKAAIGMLTNYDLDGEKVHQVEIEFETTEYGDDTGTILVVAGGAPA